MKDPRVYWNDESTERSKPYWVEDASDPRLLRFLREETNLERCFLEALNFAREQRHALHGRVLDLGAGVCWTTAILSKAPGVEHVLAIDFSEHRLLRIAPLVFEQYDAETEKIERRVDEMRLDDHEDESAEVVLFCQALYMVERPAQLLREVFRVLKPGGLAMVACERIDAPLPAPIRLRRFAGRCLRRFKHPPSASHLEREPSGRRALYDRDYRCMLRKAGFQLCVQDLGYPVFKQSSVLATNYFGLKPMK